MMPRLGLILLTALLVHCGQPAEEASPRAETVPSSLLATDDFQGGNALYHAAHITAIGDRGPASPGFRTQLDYLKNALAESGWTCQEQAFEAATPQGMVKFVNLRARFGQAPDFSPSAKGLLTCHIDTKTGIPGFTGANDGASGAAAILETARILAKDPSIASQLELVFFDGEESFAEHMDDQDGLYGSKYYAAALTAPLPAWMINLDMVGRQGKKIRIPSTTPQALYTVYSQAVRELGYSPTEWGVSAFGIMDDHVPLMERGINTLNIIDDFQDGNWWHTAKDNMDILGQESFKRTGEMTLLMLRRLLLPRST